MKRPKCYYCHSNEVKKLRRLSENWVYKCTECGLGFQHPLPSKERIRKYYQESVYPSVWGEHSGSFGKMKKITYKWIFSHLPKGGGKKLIDIGTGYGFCLAEAKKRGYKALGIEPSTQLAKIAKKESGVKVINKFIEDAKLRNDFYDVVCIFDTIEHLENPLLSFQQVVNLVRKKGYIVITTPDFESWSAKVLEKYWFHLKDEHYYYFSCKQLSRFLRKNGFRIVKCIPQKRPLTLAYLENHLQTYPIPFFSFFLHKVVSIFPQTIKDRVFTFYDGNLLLIARKK